MKIVALVSGGKDSCYNATLCQAHGHEITALANLHPHEGAPHELDSFCFQTVGHQAMELYPACTGLPLYRLRFGGHSLQQGLQYVPQEGDEVEDLHRLLAFVLEQQPDVQAVSSGAIASDYQRLRVESVCSRLGLTSLAYLWHQPQRALLQACAPQPAWPCISCPVGPGQLAITLTEAPFTAVAARHYSHSSHRLNRTTSSLTSGRRAR
jgi:diphthine-ammonia ligase